MKSGQLMEYNKTFVCKNHAENEEGRLVPDFFFFCKKALFDVKASGLQHNFNMFRQPSAWHAIKTKCKRVGTIDPRGMSNTEFSINLCVKFC